jgi:hypothetical protein
MFDRGRIRLHRHCHGVRSGCLSGVVVSLTRRWWSATIGNRFNVLSACLTQRETSLTCSFDVVALCGTNVDVGVEAFLLMRRVAIVNSVILEQLDEENRLMRMSTGEFDLIDIRHCEWRLACGARLSRSRIGGGSLLMSNDAMCWQLVWWKERRRCRVAFGAIALVLVGILGIASCSPARRAVIVNLGILEERDEANRLLCMSMGEFDSTDIGHVEWRCACRAASSRSRVGGGLPLSAIGTMCPALARREGRCHCRVAFDAIALVLVCILGIASFSSMRRAVIVNLVILEECDEADRLMCTLAGEFDLNDIGHVTGDVRVKHLGLVHGSAVAYRYCHSMQCVDCLLCAKGDNGAVMHSVQVRLCGR